MNAQEFRLIKFVLIMILIASVSTLLGAGIGWLTK